jgi:hypothetical protein
VSAPHRAGPRHRADPFWPGYFTERAQRQAQLAVARAVEDGRLDPPTDHPCLDCGVRYPACLVEYHHVVGYARQHWLTVVALCRRHHRLAHARLAGIVRVSEASHEEVRDAR